MVKALSLFFFLSWPKMAVLSLLFQDSLMMCATVWCRSVGRRGYIRTERTSISGHVLSRSTPDLDSRNLTVTTAFVTCRRWKENQIKRGSGRYWEHVDSRHHSTPPLASYAWVISICFAFLGGIPWLCQDGRADQLTCAAKTDSLIPLFFLFFTQKRNWTGSPDRYRHIRRREGRRSKYKE